MKWPKISGALHRAFRRVRFDVDKAQILVPSRPVDLHALLLGAVETEDEREELSDQGALRILESHWPCSAVIAFEWVGFGPISSSASLCVLRPGGGRAYVLPVIEDENLRAVAAIQPENVAAAWPILFRSLLNKNGADYGVGFFGSLPTRTINVRPDLIPPDVVFETYWHWLGWAMREFGQEVWADLTDDANLDAAEGEDAEPSGERRLLILKKYFERTYEQEGEHKLVVPAFGGAPASLSVASDCRRRPRDEFHLSYRPRTYWPTRTIGEVIVASVVTRENVIRLGTGEERRAAVLARKGDRRIKYRIIGQDGIHRKIRASSVAPLTLAEIVDIINRLGDETTGFLDALRGEALREFGCNPTDLLRYVTVTSEFYPDLESYFLGQAHDWADVVAVQRAIEEAAPERLPATVLGFQTSLFVDSPNAIELLRTLLRYQSDLSSAWKECYRPDLMLAMLQTFRTGQHETALRSYACWCARKAIDLEEKPAALLPIAALCRDAVRLAERVIVGRASIDDFMRARDEVLAKAPKLPRGFMQAMARQGVPWDPSRAVAALGNSNFHDAAQEAAEIVLEIVRDRHEWELSEEKIGDNVQRVRRRTGRSEGIAAAAVRRTMRIQARKLREMLPRPFNGGGAG